MHRTGLVWACTWVWVVKGIRHEHHTSMVTSHTHTRQTCDSIHFVVTDSLCDRWRLTQVININATRLFLYNVIITMCTYGCYTDINVWPKTHTRGHVCTCNLPAWVPYFFWVIGCVVRGCRVPLPRLTLPPFLRASAHVAHSLIYCCMQTLITRRSEWAWSTWQDWTLLLDSDVVCVCVCVRACVCVCVCVCMWCSSPAVTSKLPIPPSR